MAWGFKMKRTISEAPWWVLEEGTYSFSWKNGVEWNYRVRKERNWENCQSWCPFPSQWNKRLHHLLDTKGALVESGLKYTIHLDFVKLVDYVFILEPKSFFTSFWTLKHHGHEPTTYAKNHGSMRVSTTAYKTHPGNFWPAKDLPSDVQLDLV